MKIVDKNLDIALHIQLYQIIKDMIESKELEEGASIMPERELCKLQNISRMTVNKAIVNLVNEGLLERRQGKGTFVSYKKQQYRFQKLKGFTEVMSERGFNINNKILEFEIGESKGTKATSPKYLEFSSLFISSFNISKPVSALQSTAAPSLNVTEKLFIRLPI